MSGSSQITQINAGTDRASAGSSEKFTSETKLFIALLLVTVFGGAIRKWVIADNSIGNLVLLLQMILPFLLVLFRSPRAVLPFNNYRVLAFLFIYLVFQVINPYQQTFFHGMVGVVIYGGFWLLLFYYFQNRQLFQMDRLFPLILMVLAMETVLGFIQYVLPPGHFLNRYANEEAVSNIAIIGDAVRISGTFSYISGLTAFVMFYNLMAWGIMLKGYKPWIAVIALLFGLILAFMSGSRSAVFLYVGITGVMILRSFSPVQLFRFALYSIIPVAIAVMLLIATGRNQVIDRALQATNNFVERMVTLQERGEQSKRLTWGLYKLNDSERFVSPWIGLGTAATYQGTTILFGKSREVQRFGFIESEFVQIILEGGIIMFILRIVLIFSMVKALLYPKILKVLMFFVLLYAFPTVFNVHNASFMMMGLMITDNLIWRNRIAALEGRNGHKPTAADAATEESMTQHLGYPQVVFHRQG